jgi:tetratricopeptide (TPR) repeat protein
MKYTTPRNDDTSPLNIVLPEMPAPQSGWTAASRSNTQHLHQLKLKWNGRTKTDLEAIFQEAQELERLAMIGDAEKKFREALDGFEYLLSATHEDTSAVAYRLASFYAQNDRMNDADSVLDWVTEKHAERFGKGGSKTVEHILHIVEMFRNWNRNDDALLSRIIDVLGEEGEDTDNEATHPPSSNSNSASALPDMSSARTNPRQRRTSGDTTGALDCAVQPVVIDLQLGIAAGYIKTNDKEAEPFLLRLIEKCEAHPEDFSMQILRCKSALLALYHEDDRNKFNTALDQSKLSFWRFLNSNSEQGKTRSLLGAGAEIAKWHVKAGQYETADDMFIQIGSEAEKTFDADRGKIISLFQSIGFFYQNKGRWDLAEPWFEQALAACYRNFADGSVVTKRLEAALENQRYDL